MKKEKALSSISSACPACISLPYDSYAALHDILRSTEPSCCHLYTPLDPEVFEAKIEQIQQTGIAFTFSEHQVGQFQ